MKDLVISLIIFIFSLVYLAGSIALSVGTFDRPGAGFLPAGIAFALLLTSAFNVYKAYHESKENQSDGSWKRLEPIAFAACIFIYPIILKPFGFIVSTFLVLTFCLRILKYKSIISSVVIALCTAVFSFWLFSDLLGVVLPGGKIENIILML